MKKLLLIICIIFTVTAKAQQVDNYALMEVNNEEVVRGDFKIQITLDKVLINKEVYHIHNIKEDITFLMKDGVVYEFTLNTNSLQLKSLQNNLLIIYYRD